MRRTSICDKTGLKRGAWTPEEDRLLANYISKYGSWNWTQIPRFAGLSRCGKSCRLRWLNYLKPNIRRGNYTIEEEDLIIQMHEKLGNKWSRIAAALPAGRTDNEIKNYWHTHLHKRAKLNGKTKERKPKSLLPIKIEGEMQSFTIASSSSEPLESFSTLPISSPKSCDFSSSITHCKAKTIEEIDVKYESVAVSFDEEASYNGNIWDDPSLLYPMSPLSDSWYWYDHKLHVSFDI